MDTDFWLGKVVFSELGAGMVLHRSTSVTLGDIALTAGTVGITTTIIATSTVHNTAVHATDTDGRIARQLLVSSWMLHAGRACELGNGKKVMFEDQQLLSTLKCPSSGLKTSSSYQHVLLTLNA